MRFLDQGVALDELPTLPAAVAELCLQMVPEAIAKARLLSFKNISRPASSVSLRQREINAVIDARLTSATEIANLFSDVKSLSRFVLPLGCKNSRT